MSRKGNTRKARVQYVHNYMYRLATMGNPHTYMHDRKPEEPWSHIPFEDLVRTLEIWRKSFSTIPLMQYVEMTLGSPKLKKYGDEPK